MQRSEALARVDHDLTARLASSGNPAADVVMAVGTDVGSVYAVLGSAAVLAALGRPRAAIDVVGAGMFGWVAAQSLKAAVGRARPYQEHGADRLVSEPHGSSWPSGHPAVAAAVGAALAPRFGSLSRRLAAATAAFVAYSRMYVGVHYASDVVAGLGVGTLSGLFWRTLSQPRSVGAGPRPA